MKYLTFLLLLFTPINGFRITIDKSSIAPNTTYSSTVIAPAPAFYPRMFMLTYPNGTQTAAGTVARHLNSEARIRFVVRTSITPEIFVELSSVITDTSGDPSVDLDNGFTYQMPNGTLLCAYRYHIGNGTNRLYRIRTSVSYDYGMTWIYFSTVAEGPIGIWEPFMYRWSGDDSNPNAVHVSYSAELTNGGEQDIVIQDSDDGGSNWSNISSRIHTAGSRNGMPGIVELFDHSLIAVFEGFWTGEWGHFTVNSARSFDGGITWPQREIVHTPPPMNNNVSPGTAGGNTLSSGSPQVAVCPDTGKIVVIYMTNEPSNGSLPWPSGASLGSVSAHLNYSNPTQLLNWTLVPEAIIPITSSFGFWPSFLLDPEAPFRSLPKNGVKAVDYSLRVAYQGDDSVGYLTESTLCID